VGVVDLACRQEVPLEADPEDDLGSLVAEAEAPEAGQGSDHLVVDRG